ncbi:mannose-P-dolichol utilization defect 1 protein isoform X1 [Daphnia magna]|uniref:mannose-P-dolichol utilization defect 1 protein isoform X1 n=1 Tax=Daphnia magna TaxID=35525 RepID=UPI001402EB76|nr:mannose-P-dolichol utilization defect 1 protein isoform X1 [Daphnia magna]
MEYLKPVILQVLSPQCYDEFFLNFNFFHVECLKAALSKGLGLGIIAGSVLVKVPQILKLFNAKSGEGINLTAIFMELFAISANMAYSFRNEFPFSSWGEGFFLAVQTAVVAALVLLYGSGASKGKNAGKSAAGRSGSAVSAVSFLGCFSAGLALLLSPLAPMQLLWLFQASIVPIIVISKLIQAVANYRQGSTGQLSAVTVFLLTGGAAARIFTSIQETGDSMMILTYVVSTFVNCIIALQVIYYWNSGKSGKASGKKKAAKAKKNQ